MNKPETAVDSYLNGCNCAQAVFSAFCVEFGMDKKQALKIACPFGGGMGHTGETCGAVTGALMVIGLKYGPDKSDNQYAKALNYLLAQDFTARFKKRNQSVNCSELIRYDLSDEAQLRMVQQTDIFKTRCPQYVRDAVELLEEIFSEYDAVKNRE